MQASSSLLRPLRHLRPRYPAACPTTYCLQHRMHACIQTGKPGTIRVWHDGATAGEGALEAKIIAQQGQHHGHGVQSQHIKEIVGLPHCAAAYRCVFSLFYFWFLFSFLFLFFLGGCSTVAAVARVAGRVSCDSAFLPRSFIKTTVLLLI